MRKKKQVRLVAPAALIVLCVNLPSITYSQDSGPWPLPHGIRVLLDQVVTEGLSDKQIAVVPLLELGNEGDCSTLLGRFIATRINTQLIQRGGQVVTREQLDKAMREIDLNRRHAFDGTKAQRLGKQVGADMILTGSLVKLTSTIEVDIILFETETGKAPIAGHVALVKDKDVEKLADAALGTDCQDFDAATVRNNSRDTAVLKDTRQTIQAHGVDVTLEHCKRRNPNVDCSFSMVSPGEDRRVVIFGKSRWEEYIAKLHDGSGNEYLAAAVKIGREENEEFVEGIVIADVRKSAAVTFRGVPLDITEIEAVELSLTVAGVESRIVFRHVKISD